MKPLIFKGLIRKHSKLQTGRRLGKLQLGGKPGKLQMVASAPLNPKPHRSALPNGTPYFVSCGSVAKPGSLPGKNRQCIEAL